MRETLKDWKKEWIDTNGHTKKLEVIICESTAGESSLSIYEGSFEEIPNGIIGRKVIEHGKILDSTIPERIGAYSLLI